jgi:outer membrane protein TolC
MTAFDAKRLVLVLPVLLAACGSLRPEPITPEEHVGRAQADFARMYANNEPITGEVSLQEAIARALKYNYDAELARQQATLNDRQVDLAMSAMLPRLALNAGYNARSNDPAAKSVSIPGRRVSQDWTYSEEQTHVTAGPEFTWSVIDVGIGYLQAKQQGYQALAAVERRRRVVADVVKRVQDSYWKAQAAARVLPRLEPLIARAEQVLEASRNSARRNLAPEMQTLEFQRSMLGVMGQLRRISTDLNASRIQLATLISVPTTTRLVLADRAWALKPDAGRADMAKLEEMGLALRPELREEAYQEQIDRQDVYKEIIRMLPGVGILANFNYDSNKYLYNSTWAGVGVQASFNIFNIIRGPKAIAAAEQSVEVSRARRLAVSVGVISQINLAYQDYRNALEDMRTAREINDVEQRIRRASANAVEARELSEAERLRRELASVVAELNYYRAVAQVRLALVNLYTSCGVDLVPPTADITDLKTLTRDVEAAIAPWVEGQPPNVTLPPPAQPRG